MIKNFYNNSYHASIGMPPYEALYRRKCRSLLYWEEVVERRILRPELVQWKKEKVDLIRQRLVAAQDRQSRYANQTRRYTDFEIGELVLLKVSPWKGLVQFGKKGKLSPRFIGPFEILKRVGKVAYELALPPNLQHVHNVIYVSMLRKYNPDTSHIIEYKEVEIQIDLSYVEQPIEIIDQKEQILRTKTIPLVQVLWRNHKVEESTWESETTMREKYPHLFSD